MEKELCFGCCFPFSTHFQTMWISACFYQGRWDLWNDHFYFSFFLPVTKSRHKVSSLQESHQAEHIQLKWKISVLQFSVTSTLWMQDSVCTTGTFQPHLTLSSSTSWLPQKCKEPVSKNHTTEIISGFRDKHMQLSWTCYLCVLFMVRIIQIYPTGTNLQVQLQFGSPLKFMQCLLVTQ